MINFPLMPFMAIAQNIIFYFASVIPLFLYFPRASGLLVAAPQGCLYPRFSTAVGSCAAISSGFIGSLPPA